MVGASRCFASNFFQFGGARRAAEGFGTVASPDPGIGIACTSLCTPAPTSTVCVDDVAGSPFTGGSAAAFLVAIINFKNQFPGGLGWRARRPIGSSGIRNAAKASAAARRRDQLCRHSCRRHLQSRAAAGIATPSDRTTASESTNDVDAWCGALSPVFSVRGSSLSCAFFLPRTLFEPPTVFKIGYPSDYALGVDTKWQQKYRIWVDRTPDRRFRHLRALHASRVARPIGKPAKTNSSVPATAAVTTAKA